MNYKVSEIFAQKVNEIQNRIPMKIKNIHNSLSFDNILNSALKNSDTAADAAKDREFPLQKNNDSIQESISKNISYSANKYGIDANLVRAIIKQESNYNPNALSKVGAQGLMQIMPGTASFLGINDPWNIEENIDGGIRYLKDQLSTFNGDLRLSLAAYNAGPNAVHKYNGIPPFSETKDYVEKVMQYYDKYTKENL